jgi:N-acetylglucosaminyldiphosphoundecaprenol N-acetyl-beta-D-mannosaminyltransferase
VRKYFDLLYKKDSNTFYNELKKYLKKEERKFIITANSETFIYGTKDEEMNKMLLDKNSILVPDGIGIVKAARKLDYNVEERIAGVDIAAKLLEYANELKLGIYLFGAKKEVLDLLVKRLNNEYPNIKILGYKDGYVKDKDKVFKEITSLKPDIVLVAMGIPAQEKLIYKHLSKFKKGIFVGVGGSFDVLSGSKKRAPKIFIKLNLEWLYRISKEPKRIKRFYDSNIKFMFKVKKKILEKK